MQMLTKAGIDDGSMLEFAQRELEQSLLALAVAPGQSGSEAAKNLCEFLDVVIKRSCKESFLGKGLAAAAKVMVAIAGAADASLSALEGALASLDDCGAADEPQGAMWEFLQQHSVGKRMLREALVVCANRSGEAAMQEKVDEVETMTKALRAQDIVHQSFVEEHIVPLEALAAALLAKKNKGNREGGLTDKQRQAVLLHQAEGWAHVRKRLSAGLTQAFSAGLRLALQAKASKGIVTSPGDGGDIRGAVDLEALGASMSPPFLQNSVWSTSGARSGGPVAPPSSGEEPCPAAAPPRALMAVSAADMVKRYQHVVSTVAQVLKYVLSQEPTINIIFEQAPQVYELNHWVALEPASMLPFCDDPSLQQQYASTFVAVLEQELSRSADKAYRHVEVMVRQCLEGAHAGITLNAVAELMRRLPTAGPINTLIEHFGQEPILKYHPAILKC